MKCIFCKQESILYLCRLKGDVYVTHLFKACLNCIEKMDLTIIEVTQEVCGGKEHMEGVSPRKRLQ